MNGLLGYLVARSVGGETLSAAQTDKPADRGGPEGDRAADWRSRSAPGTLRPRPRSRYDYRASADAIAGGAMPSENTVETTTKARSSAATATPPEEARRTAPPQTPAAEPRHDAMRAPSRSVEHAPTTPTAPSREQRAAPRTIPSREDVGATPTGESHVLKRKPAPTQHSVDTADAGHNTAIVVPDSIRPHREPASADRSVAPLWQTARTPTPQGGPLVVRAQTRDPIVAGSAERSVSPHVSQRRDAPLRAAARTLLPLPIRLPPPVQVSIGRVEVHATVAPAPSSAPVRTPSKPAMSLDDYLKGRDSGGANGGAL
jgi:hypothetical protein